MGTVARVLVCGLTVIMVGIVIGAIELYAGSEATNSYLVGGIGGAAGVLVWQLTARKKS